MVVRSWAFFKKDTLCLGKSTIFFENFGNKSPSFAKMEATRPLKRLSTLKAETLQD